MSEARRERSRPPALTSTCAPPWRSREGDHIEGIPARVPGEKTGGEGDHVGAVEPPPGKCLQAFALKKVASPPKLSGVVALKKSEVVPGVSPRKLSEGRSRRSRQVSLHKLARACAGRAPGGGKLRKARHRRSGPRAKKQGEPARACALKKGGLSESFPERSTKKAPG